MTRSLALFTIAVAVFAAASSAGASRAEPFQGPKDAQRTAATRHLTGIVTKIDAHSLELVVAKTGFVTLALSAGRTLPRQLQLFDLVRVRVVVGADGKLTALAIKRILRDRDDRRRDQDDEVEIKGTISVLTATSITATTRRGTAVTCALRRPLSRFAVGDFVELKCIGSTVANALVLQRIEHEDDGDRHDDDDDHSGPGRGGGDDDDDDDDHSGPGGGGG